MKIQETLCVLQACKTVKADSLSVSIGDRTYILTRLITLKLLSAVTVVTDIVTRASRHKFLGRTHN